MSETKSDTRKYKGISYRVTKLWSGSTRATVIFPGGPYFFDSIKAAKSFISTVTGK